MIRMSVSDILGVTGGYLADGADPEAIVTGAVEFDSRRIGPGARGFRRLRQGVCVDPGADGDEAGDPALAEKGPDLSVPVGGIGAEFIHLP